MVVNKGWWLALAFFIKMHNCTKRSSHNENNTLHFFANEILSNTFCINSDQP